MKTLRTPPRDEARADRLRAGAYLTDGSALFSVLGELPGEPSLRLLEDCRTLEVLVVHVDDLRGSRVREVHARRGGATTGARSRRR